MSAPVQALEALNEALEILENALEPLFEKPLSETIDSHEQLEQAKLCAMIPYIVNELINTYLRTRGIPPSTHPVNTEVDRIKRYFRKIATAENPDKIPPRESDQHLQLDKAAADRFIRAALAEADRAVKGQAVLPSDTIPGLPAQGQKASPPQRLDEQPPEGGTHSRFSRTVHEKREDESSSESMSGIELELRQIAVPEPEKKRKRPVMDPFTGYVDPIIKRAKKKDRSKSKPSSQKADPAQGGKKESRDMVSQGTPPTHEEQGEGSTKPKKARKKSKKRGQLLG